VSSEQESHDAVASILAGAENRRVEGPAKLGKFFLSILPIPYTVGILITPLIFGHPYLSPTVS
jgi:hypothetical protein